MFARRHLDFLAEPFDISNRLVDAVFGVARALVDEGVTRLTERASFLEPSPPASSWSDALRASCGSNKSCGYLNTKQWANFTAKVETLCSEFIHAIERDRYSPAEVI